MKRHVALPAAVLLVLLAGCSAPAPASPDGVQSPAGTDALVHVHGAYADPQTGRLLLASHNGLFDATTDPAGKIGPTIDLMGFAADGKGAFYASGHPGPGVDLPNPVGLLKSTDGGRNWTPLSRAGESDFHALTTTKSGIVGFDGTMRTSPDGRDWTAVPEAPDPYALAGSPENDIVLATTEQGLWRSEDGGSTWTARADGPILLTAAFVDASTVVGVTPDGAVHLSDNTGKAWKEAGEIEGQPAAITGIRTDNGQVSAWIATAGGTTERLDLR